VNRRIVSKICSLGLFFSLLLPASLSAAQQSGSEEEDVIYYVGSTVLSLIHFPMKLTSCVGTSAITGVAYVTLYQVPGGFEEGTTGKDIGEVAREACTGSWLVASSRVKVDNQPGVKAEGKSQGKEIPVPKAMAKTEAEEKEAPVQTAEAKEPPAEKVVVKEVIKEVPKIVEIEKLILPDIAFRFDSSELTEFGKGTVYVAAQKLKKTSATALVVAGHADYIGTDEYNKKLGLRRAETVKRELIRLGVKAAKIGVETFGESQPLVDERAGWARAVNRRVEIQIKNP
jgi:outer membrane protein OmpA-like peptidoglycan-associated protein